MVAVLAAAAGFVAAANTVAQMVPHTVAVVGLSPILFKNQPLFIYISYKNLPFFQPLPVERRHPFDGSVALAEATRIGAAADRPTKPAQRWVWPRRAGHQLLAQLVRNTVEDRTDQFAAGAGRKLM